MNGEHPNKVEAPTTEPVVHAIDASGDRTFCGYTLDREPVPDTARPGFAVTCPDCKQMIAHGQDRFTGNYRYKA